MLFMLQSVRGEGEPRGGNECGVLAGDERLGMNERLGSWFSLIESCSNFCIGSQLLSWWLWNSSPDVGFNSLAIRCIDFS